MVHSCVFIMSYYFTYYLEDGVLTCLGKETLMFPM